jgi:response regulator RpfG family c-di-GMP phosphodiesterase
MVNLDQVATAVDTLKEGKRLRQAQVMLLDEAMEELLWFRENFEEMRQMTDKADRTVEMIINVVKRVIQARNGDRSAQTKMHATYKVFLNNVELAEFTGYDSMWQSYRPCEYQMLEFVEKLKVALPDSRIDESTYEEYYNVARNAALAKLTAEERKLLCI